MLSEEQMRTVIAEKVEYEYDGVQTAAAADFGMSDVYLSLVLRGKTTISEKVAQKFGFRRVIMYKEEL